MKKLILGAFVCLLSTLGHSQATGFAYVESTHLVLGDGTAVSGTYTLTPNNCNGVPIPFVRATGGAVAAKSFSGGVTAGAFTATVPDTATSTPANICYALQVLNSADQTLAIGPGQGYDTLQPTHAVPVNLDTYVPNLTAIIPVQTGPAGAPGAGFNPRGAWAPYTAYNTSPNYDTVVYSGAMYYCVTAHTSTSTFDSTKWQVMVTASSVTIPGGVQQILTANGSGSLGSPLSTLGSGSVILDTGGTLTNPVLNGASVASGKTLTIPAGSTINIAGSCTGAGCASVVVPGSSGQILTANGSGGVTPVSTTGSSTVVLSTSPTITSPVLNSPVETGTLLNGATVPAGNTLSIPAGATLSIAGTCTGCSSTPFSGTSGQIQTTNGSGAAGTPLSTTGTGSSVVLAASPTLTTPTLSSPTLNSPTINGTCTGTGCGGNINLNFRGAWSSSTAYAVNDSVTYGSGTWVAILASTNQIPALGSTYWTALSQIPANITATSLNAMTSADQLNTGTGASSSSPYNGIATYLASGVGGTHYAGRSGVTFEVNQNYAYKTALLSSSQSYSYDEPGGFPYPACWGGVGASGDGDLCGFYGWPVNVHFHDVRDGTTIEAYNDPVFRFGGQGSIYPLGYITGTAADGGTAHLEIYDYDVPYGGGYHEPFELLQHDFDGGVNQNSGSGLGKNNSIVETVKMVGYDQRQHLLGAFYNFCYGLGDCLGNAVDISYAGGLSTNSDEGIHNGDSWINEQNDVFSGGCDSSGCATTGSTSIVVCAGWAPQTGSNCPGPSGLTNWSSTTTYTPGKMAEYPVNSGGMYISTGTNLGSGQAPTVGGSWLAVPSGDGLAHQGDGRLLIDLADASAGLLGSISGSGRTAVGIGNAITASAAVSGPTGDVSLTAPSGTFTPSTAYGTLSAAITTTIADYSNPSQVVPLAWNSGIAYTTGRVVTYSGVTYIATGSTTAGVAPPTGNWSTSVNINAIPVTFTVGSIAGTNAGGFATGSTVCLSDASANGTREQIAVQSVGTLSGGTQTVTGYPIKNHPVTGTIVSQGGTCGWAMALTADTHVQAGRTFYDVWPLDGSPDSSHTYAGNGGDTLGGIASSPKTSAWVYAQYSATVTYAGSTATLTCSSCFFSNGGASGSAVLGNISGQPIAVSGATGGYTPYNVSAATATVTAYNTLTYPITGTPTNNTAQSVTFTYCQCTFTMWPYAEVLSVYNQTYKLVDGTLTLAANNVPFHIGDLMEQPHWYQPAIPNMSHLNIGPITPVTGPWGSGLYYSGNFISGQLRGWEIDNSASSSSYLGHGGILTAPQALLWSDGMWAGDIHLGVAPEQYFVYIPCKAASPAGGDGCTKWDAAYYLYTLGNSAGGLSNDVFDPNGMNWTFQANAGQLSWVQFGANLTGTSGGGGLEIGRYAGTTSVGLWLNGGTLLSGQTGTEAKIVTSAAAGTSGNCAQWDASGGISDAGSACGAGSGFTGTYAGTIALNTTGSAGSTIGNASSSTTINGSTSINVNGSSGTSINTGTNSGAIYLGNANAPILVTEQYTNWNGPIVFGNSASTSVTIGANGSFAVGPSGTATSGTTFYNSNGFAIYASVYGTSACLPFVGTNFAPTSASVWNFAITAPSNTYCSGQGISSAKETFDVSSFVDGLYVSHLLSKADGTVTIAAGTGAGTSPTVSLTSATDVKGTINVTTGTTPTASAIIATITFGKAYQSAPVCIVTPASANAVGSFYSPPAATGTFTINSIATALTASTVYTFSYECEN